MARIHGKNGFIGIGGQDLSGDSNRFTLNIEQDVVETTAFSDTAKTFVEGKYGWTLEFTSFFNTGATKAEGIIDAAVGGGNQSMTIGPEGTATGVTRYTGDVLLENYSTETPVDGVVVLTASLRGNGARTRSTA